MRLPTGTIVALADGGRYLLLVNRGDEDIVNLRHLSHAARPVPPTRALGREKPGRFPGIRPGGGSPEAADLHERTEQSFGKDLMKRLRQMADDDEMRHLVIVADPDTLGELRAQYEEAIRKALMAEIPRDLLKHPVPDIERAISEWSPG